MKHDYSIILWVRSEILSWYILEFPGARWSMEKNDGINASTECLCYRIIKSAPSLHTSTENAYSKIKKQETVDIR